MVNVYETIADENESTLDDENWEILSTSSDVPDEEELWKDAEDDELGQVSIASKLLACLAPTVQLVNDAIKSDIQAILWFAYVEKIVKFFRKLSGEKSYEDLAIIWSC